MSFVLGSEEFGMLSASREIKIDGNVIAQTPTVVPSFSSKGFPDVSHIIECVIRNDNGMCISERL